MGVARAQVDGEGQLRGVRQRHVAQLLGALDLLLLQPLLNELRPALGQRRTRQLN